MNPSPLALVGEARQNILLDAIDEKTITRLHAGAVTDEVGEPGQTRRAEKDRRNRHPSEGCLNWAVWSNLTVGPQHRSRGSSQGSGQGTKVSGNRVLQDDHP